jgi:tRNA threonylcarbamoyladenosine biosynthesis protein TsaE
MAGSLDLATASPEETRALGEAIAAVLQAHDVVSLTGDLGAGKTTFVQGAARGLGVEEPVLSPTFTLIREYAGRMLVFHVDVYRLDRLQEVMDLGLEELLDQQAVLFVEWGDAIEALLPDAHLQVEITIPDHGPGREFRVTAVGPSWAGRLEGVAALTEPWAGSRRGDGR